MCKHCEMTELPWEGLSHEFYITGRTLWHYDSDLGWEGDDIKYCPYCGRELIDDIKQGPGPVRILDDEPDLSTREGILEAAKQCVCTDREGQYGSPEDNFRLIAKLWSEYLRAIGLGDGSDEWDLISADEVAVMMCLLKIARIATGKPKADSWIDLAGYAACGGEIQARRANR